MSFSYTTNPGYPDLVYDVYRTIKWHYREDNWANYTNFFDEFRRFYHFKVEEAIPIVYIAIAFTLVRYAFELFLCKVTALKVILGLKFWPKFDRSFSFSH